MKKVIALLAAVGAVGSAFAADGGVNVQVPSEKFVTHVLAKAEGSKDAGPIGTSSGAPKEAKKVIGSTSTCEIFTEKVKRNGKVGSMETKSCLVETIE